jgi:hypothetical protein
MLRRWSDTSTPWAAERLRITQPAFRNFKQTPQILPSRLGHEGGGASERKIALSYGSRPNPIF